MKFLADESCDFAVVRVLCELGYDVTSVSEISPSIDDVEVIKLAVKDGRILLTEDKDFGQLVHAYGHKTGGVVLLRYPATARKQLVEDVRRLVKAHGKKLAGCFVIAQPGRIRFSRPR